MWLYIYLGSCDVRIQMPPGLSSVAESIRSLFIGKIGNAPREGNSILDCTVHQNDGKYHFLLNSVKYNGPTVDVSQGVWLQYGFQGSMTRIKVRNTAIIEFDEKNPLKSDVWLAPDWSKIKSRDLDVKTRFPLPEAFFYPMLAEQIRNFGACLIHCGAIGFNGRAVIFVGPPGSGKSTQILRLLLHGADFLADDLAILSRESDGELRLHPLRGVANVHKSTMNMFQELAFLKSAPCRGDDKFTIDIERYFNQRATESMQSGLVIRIDPDQEAWMRECEPQYHYHGMHNMAFFTSRPAPTKLHFDLLTSWLTESKQYIVSQGFLAKRLDKLAEVLKWNLSTA